MSWFLLFSCIYVNKLDERFVKITWPTNIEYNLFDLDTYNIFIRTELFILIQNLAI